MTKQQIQQVTIGSLLLIFSVLWMTQWDGGRSHPIPAVTTGISISPDSTEVPDPQQPGSPSAPAEEKIIPARDLFQRPALLEEKLKERQRRPLPASTATTLPAPAPAELPKIKLQAILWEGSRPMALVDHRLVSVGDMIQGAKILSITEEGVKVLFSGQEFYLKLNGRE